MNRDDDCCEGGHGLRIVFGIIFGLLIFTIVISAVFGAFYYPMNGMMFPSHWLWTLIGLFFLIWFVSWIFRWPWHYRRHGYWRGHEHDAGREIRILRRRYARGEITEAEFKRMMKVLKEEDSGEEEEEEIRKPATKRRKR
jgi:uncharacterized membrane protein